MARLTAPDQVSRTGAVSFEAYAYRRARRMLWQDRAITEVMRGSLLFSRDEVGRNP